MAEEKEVEELSEEDAEKVVGSGVRPAGWEIDQQNNYVYTEQQWREIRRNR